MATRGIRNKDGSLNGQKLRAAINNVIKEEEIRNPKRAKESRISSRIFYIYDRSNKARVPRINKYAGAKTKNNAMVFMKIFHPTESITWLVTKVAEIGDGDDLQFSGFVIDGTSRPKWEKFKATELCTIDVNRKGIYIDPNFRRSRLGDICGDPISFQPKPSQSSKIKFSKEDS